MRGPGSWPRLPVLGQVNAGERVAGQTQGILYGVAQFWLLALFLQQLGWM